jgi:dolichyl-phosphate-mannose--protein O-mannosyl transferase
MNDASLIVGFYSTAGLAFLIWMIALISHLRRTDYSDTDKIIWTVVLCTLNILGVILYWFFAPRGDDGVLSEQELKDKFNRQ